MTRRWLALLLPLPFLAAGCGYNTIQTLDEQANSARSTTWSRPCPAVFSVGPQTAGAPMNPGELERAEW